MTLAARQPKRHGDPAWATALPAWFIAFVDADGAWYHRWLAPGFRHCFAFAWDAAADRWVIANPAFNTVLIRAMPPGDAPAFFVELATLRARVVLARVEGARRTRPRFVLTCVSAIEALLGLKTACALTPRRLYRSLVARGATVVME